MKMNKKMNKTKKKEQNNENPSVPLFIFFLLAMFWLATWNPVMISCQSPLSALRACKTNSEMKPIMKTLENQPNETCEVQAHFTSVKS